MAKASKTKTGYARVTLYIKKGADPTPPGGKVTLASEDFDDLVLRGFVGERPAGMPATVTEEPKEAPKPSGKALMDAIIAAIGQLDKDTEEGWTASGKHSVPALEKLLGYDISAEERNAAWEVAGKGQALAL